MIDPGTTSRRFEIIEETLHDENNMVTVSDLCRLSGVSRSGYYRWLGAADKRGQREQQDREDFERILEAYKYRGRAKGARGIHMRLLHLEDPVIMNVKKIRRLMKKYHLTCPIRKPNPYRQMMRAIQTSYTAENLVDRRFTEAGPGVVLLTDITYIPDEDGFCYLSTVIDAVTRQCLSYVLSDSLKEDFVLETIDQLMRDHGISLHAKTLIHSDQGAHYTSVRFRELLKDKGLRQSMSRRGNCWDNAPQESFFGHMKDEVTIDRSLSFEETKAEIDDWIDYYNNDRYQWGLAKLSPNEYAEYLTTGIYPLKI
jgi:transposase InsO family protein